MSLEQKTVNINGQDYMISQFAATKGIGILKSLAKLLGPSFAELSKGQEESEQGAVGLALEKLFDNFDSVDVEKLVKDLMHGVSKSNVAINFDMEFSGNYDTLFALSKEVVEFNFGSVFTLLGTEI